MNLPVACLAEHWEQHELHEESSGKIALLFPRPNILYNRVEGHLSQGLFPHIIRLGDEAIAAGNELDIFCDWETMTSYDAAARNGLSAWVAKRYSDIESCQFITTSMIVTMGVMLAGTAFRTVRMHRVRTEFDSSIESSLANWVPATD